MFSKSRTRQAHPSQRPLATHNNPPPASLDNPVPGIATPRDTASAFPRPALHPETVRHPPKPAEDSVLAFMPHASMSTQYGPLLFLWANSWAIPCFFLLSLAIAYSLSQSQDGGILIGEFAVDDASVRNPGLSVDRPLCITERTPGIFKRCLLVTGEGMVLVGRGFGETSDQFTEPGQLPQQPYIRGFESVHKGIMPLGIPALAGRVASTHGGFDKKVKMTV